MSCNEHQLQMSLCLDGRLPAGSRAAVLAHIAGCIECERVWTDLQKAQDLVLNLPVQRTTRDFRQSLWARIESGEGAPEVRLSEPVSLMTKARYILAGAAAAALLLVAGRLTFGTSPSAKAEAPASASEVASGPRAPVDVHAAHDGSLRPKERFANAEVIDFSPETLANEFAQRTARNVRMLRSRLCADSARPPRSFVEPEVLAAVHELRTAVDVMRWLRDDGLLAALPGEVETDLQLLTRVAQGNTDSQVIQAVVCEGAQLEELPKHLYIRQSVDRRTFLQSFKLRLDRDPRLKRDLSLQFSPDAGGQIFVMIQGTRADFPTGR